MERLWNSEYVRINQYKNEILKSLDSLSMIEMKVEKSNPDHWVCKGQNEWGKQFIMSLFHDVGSGCVLRIRF